MSGLTIMCETWERCHAQKRVDDAMCNDAMLRPHQGIHHGQWEAGHLLPDGILRMMAPEYLQNQTRVSLDRGI
jgi:hypothetical protein